MAGDDARKPSPHLTGSMRPAMLAELADALGLPLPKPLEAGAVHAWGRFPESYDLARAVLRTQEDVARVVAEAIEDDPCCGAAWTEIQVDPISLAPVPRPLDVQAGLRIQIPVISVA
jgi:adenosine deaminase